MRNDKTIEFQGPRETDSGDGPSVLCLMVLSGPEQGAVYQLEEGEIIAGRSQEAKMLFSEAGVSRKHARFTLSNGAVTVEDLGSTNGTFVNGTKIVSAQVQPGDTLGLGGRTSIRLSLMEEKMSQIFAELYREAALDPSGVLNLKTLKPRLKASPDHSLAVVEIDQSEQTRDRFGHSTEEELATHIASILKNDLADKAVVGRLSGESFLLNLECRALDTVDVLDRVRRAIEFNHFRIDTANGPEFIRITISCGIAAFVEKEEYEETLKAAEDALMMAKQMGRNRVHLSERRKFGR